jgi:hypothetical protein
MTIKDNTTFVFAVKYFSCEYKNVSISLYCLLKTYLWYVFGVHIITGIKYEWSVT